MEILIIFILFLFLINLIRNIQLYSVKENKNYYNYNNNPPLVSVLIPARNEEKNIEKCILSLIYQDYPNYEIIILNDNSTDNTYEIIKSLTEKYNNIKIINGSSVPQEWVGKSFACYQLAMNAKGKWLIFTDADTIHKSNCISTMINEAICRNVDFLTLLPFKTTNSIIGKVFLPIINFFFSVLFPGFLLDSKFEKLSFALGPFILVKKDIYWKINGHKSVKDKVVEDVFLSRNIKKVGGKIAIINGTNYMNVFYYNNFKELWNGFSKNFFGALENSSFIAFLLVFLVTLTFLIPYYEFFNSLFFTKVFLFYNIVQIVIISLIWIILIKSYNEPYYIIILFPLCFFVTYLILFNSIYLSVNKKLILWKDRKYEV